MPGRVLPARLSAPDLEPGYYPAGRGRAAATIARRELAARPTLIRPLWFFARYTRHPPATWERDCNTPIPEGGGPSLCSELVQFATR